MASEQGERTMAWRIVEGTFVVVHSQHNPSDAEWAAHCADYRAHCVDVVRVIVDSLGGSPNAAQRHRLKEALEGRPPPRGAILTTSTLTRGAVTALNWFLNNRLRAYAPGEIVRAFDYLEMSPSLRQTVLSTLRELRVELGLPPR